MRFVLGPLLGKLRQTFQTFSQTLTGQGLQRGQKDFFSHARGEKGAFSFFLDLVGIARRFLAP